MPPRSRAPDKRPNFDKPEAFPAEVRAQVVAIKMTRQMIDTHAPLFKHIPSFAALNERFADLSGSIDELVSWIKQYLDGDIDFDGFEHEMRHLLADSIRGILDHTPIDSRSRKNASPLEDQLFSDVAEVMERVWEAVSEQGYKLHTAMIRA